MDYKTPLNKTKTSSSDYHTIQPCTIPTWQLDQDDHFIGDHQTLDLVQYDAKSLNAIKQKKQTLMLVLSANRDNTSHAFEAIPITASIPDDSDWTLKNFLSSQPRQLTNHILRMHRIGSRLPGSNTKKNEHKLSVEWIGNQKHKNQYHNNQKKQYHWAIIDNDDIVAMPKVPVDLVGKIRAPYRYDISEKETQLVDQRCCRARKLFIKLQLVNTTHPNINQPTGWTLKRIAMTFGHLFTEGVLKSFGWIVVAEAFSSQAVTPWSLALCLPLIPGALMNQFDFVGRIGPLSYQGTRENYDPYYILNRQILQPYTMLWNPNTGEISEKPIPYPDSSKCLWLSYYRTIVNAIVDFGISAASAHAIADHLFDSVIADDTVSLFLQVILFGVLIAGVIQTTLSTKVMTSIAWEHYCEEKNLTSDGEVIAPLEEQVPLLRYRDQQITSVVAIIAPPFYAGLHILATAYSDLLSKIPHKGVEISCKTILGLVGGLAALWATNTYEVDKLGFNINKNLIFYHQNIKRPWLKHCAEFFNGTKVGKLTTYLSQKNATRTLSGGFFIGLFFLFEKAMRRFNHSIVKQLLHNSGKDSWFEAWQSNIFETHNFSTEDMVILMMSAWGAWSQTKQVMPSFSKQYERLTTILTTPNPNLENKEESKTKPPRFGPYRYNTFRDLLNPSDANEDSDGSTYTQRSDLIKVSGHQKTYSDNTDSQSTTDSSSYFDQSELEYTGLGFN